MLKDYVEKSFLKYINNDGVPCSDSSETKIYALNSSLLKTKQVVDILFIQIRTILLKLLYRATLPTNTQTIIKGYLILYDKVTLLIIYKILSSLYIQQVRVFVNKTRT